MPKVSALMPVYNTDLAYLKESIQSVLNQSFSDFELLILNDSPQNVELENCILEYAKKDKRIQYFKNPRNLGISLSRNKLIDLAKGEFLAVIDHDDVSVEKRFEKEVVFLEENKEIGVVGGYYEDMLSHKIHKFPLQDAEIKIALMYSCALCHPSTMIRKSVLDAHKLRYNAFYSPCEDYKLWCDLIAFTDFANLDEVLIKYKSFDNTSTEKKTKIRQLYSAIVKSSNEAYPQLSDIAYENLPYECKSTVSIFGIPLFTIIEKNTYTKIKLFDKIGLLKIKKDLL